MPNDPEAALSSMLPLALNQKDFDARVIVPAHPLIKELLGEVQAVASLNLIGTTAPLKLLMGKTLQGLTIYLAELPGLERPSRQTGKSTAALVNYTLFSRAVAAVATDSAGLNWQADIVHHNDWETGLISALLHIDNTTNIKTVFTLPEGGELGCIDPHAYRSFYLAKELLTEDGLLWEGQLSFLKAATVYADELILRSPNLHKEIETTTSQSKLAYLLSSRKGPIRSFSHGVNHLLWNPTTDPHTVQQYDIASIRLKKINKLRLQHRLKQEEDASILLLAYSGPVTQDAGISHILSTLPDLAYESGIRLIIQTWGDKDSIEHLLNQQTTYPDLVTVLLGKDEELNHQIIAAADCVLLPSPFPLSGEKAVAALTYGTIPIASSAGVHQDYITDTTSRSSLNGSATGFLYPADRPSALTDTIRRVKVFRDKPGVWWDKVATNCMHHPFTTEQIVTQYIDLYNSIRSGAES